MRRLPEKVFFEQDFLRRCVDELQFDCADAVAPSLVVPGDFGAYEFGDRVVWDLDVAFLYWIKLLKPITHLSLPILLPPRLYIRPPILPKLHVISHPWRRILRRRFCFLDGIGLNTMFEAEH